MYPIQGPLTINDHFDDGDVQTGRDATDMNAKFLNDVQDEILNAVEGSGQTPSPDDQHQLEKAISLRGFHVFDGASAALDADTGIPSGKVKNAIVVLHNASQSSVSGFQFPAAASCAALGMVIVVPDWSGTGASSFTASAVISQLSGTVIPIFNGNIFVAIFNGDGVLGSAKTLSLPYRGNKTFSEVGKLAVNGDLRVVADALFDAAVVISGNVSADNANFSTVNSNGFSEDANFVGNKFSKPFCVNGFHIDASQSLKNTITRGLSFFVTTSDLNLTSVSADLGSSFQRLVVYNGSSAAISVTFASGQSLSIYAKSCQEFIKISGSPANYVWAPIGHSVYS